MDILTDKDKELLRSQGKGLEMLKWQISELSATYSRKGCEMLLKDRNDAKGQNMIGISNNLNFGIESIDLANERGKELVLENKYLKGKNYDQMVKIDQKDAEIKRLNKLINELKKNVEL